MTTEDTTLRVISWNVNGIRARWARLSEMLAGERPDVVCLQETRCPDKRFPRGRLRELGYLSQHSPGSRRGGVAILVRADHRERMTHPSAALDHKQDIAEGRWLEVTIEGIAIGCVYVPAGHTRSELDDAGKLAFLVALAHQAQEEHEHPLLLVGDFNVAPTDQDVYEPSWFEDSYLAGPSEREDLREIMREGDLVDVYRELHPDDRGFTCWDQRDGHYARDYGLRIDLALASHDVAARVTRCEVAHNYRQGHRPSNHAPLEIDLEGGAAGHGPASRGGRDLVSESNDVEQCAHCLDATAAAGAGD